MEIADALVPIISVVIGAAAGHFFTVSQKQREMLDDWWEDYAVKNGVEPIISYLNECQVRLAPEADTFIMKPKSAFTRLKILTGESIIELICNDIALNGSLGSQGLKAGKERDLYYVEVINSLNNSLIRLQACFYNHKIIRKSDILNVHKSPPIKAINNEVSAIFRDYYDKMKGGILTESDMLHK